jgi:hypothetical protein
MLGKLAIAPWRRLQMAEMVEAAVLLLMMQAMVNQLEENNQWSELEQTGWQNILRFLSLAVGPHDSAYHDQVP